MYSSRRGLGIAPVIEAGAAFGPQGVAVAAIVSGLSYLLGIMGGDPIAANKLAQFQANPTVDNAISTRDYLVSLQNDLERTAPVSGGQGDLYGGYNDITPWLASNIASLDDFIRSGIASSPMNYQGPGADEPETVFSVDASEPADGSIVVIPAVVPIDSDAFPEGPTVEKAGASSILPFLLPVAAGAAAAGAAAGGTSAGGGSNPYLNPSNYGFLYKLLPKGGNPLPGGGCDCSGKEPNYLAWIVALGAAWWATSGNAPRRRKRKAAKRA